MAPWYRYDGIGGLSGGGATSTFLMAYEPEIRSEIMDWMFKPGFASSLNILKVEIGCDDETTDGCESCHMRSPGDVNCSRGYEWDVMRHSRGACPREQRSQRLPVSSESERGTTREQGVP